MTRAILVCWHKYTPFGGEYYQPIFEFFIQQMEKYKDEYDKIYFIDSTWNFTDDDYEKMKSVKGMLVKVNPHLRYYDAYKEVLPQVKEDLVLFMDNDMVVYKKGKIAEVFSILKYSQADVVSIYDTIGTMKVDLPDGKNKFCPYWFATRKDTLMKYLNVDWSPDSMPYTETFGLLTEAMLKDRLKPCEWPEDKGEVLSRNPLETKKNTGTYHVRAGSTIAYLLATKHYGDIKTYEDYLRNQPRAEILRHCSWYQYIGGDASEIVSDL